MLSRWIARAVVGLLTVLAAIAGAADEPALLGDWIEIVSPRFVLLSTADEATSRDLAADLENLHGVLAGLMGGEPEPIAPPRVFILGSRRTFERLAFLPSHGEAPVTGLFRNAPDASYLVVDGSRPGEATATLYHEYVHQLAAALLPGLPLWFEEGLAELYQTFQVVDGAAEIGRPVPGHIERLASRGLLPLAEVLEVRRESPLYSDPDDKPTLYAECWALVHSLVLGHPQRVAATRRFLTRIRRGEDAHTAFTAELGHDLGRLEAELAGYVRQTSFRYARIPIASPADPRLASVRGLTPAEAHAALGDLLLSEDPPGADAAAHLEAAAATDPPPALALSGLAVLAEHRADWARALDLHRRAVAAGGDELVLLRAAEIELHRGAGPETAADLARRAVARRPGYARAQETLASALLAGDVSGPESLSAAGRAASLLPRDLGALHTLLDAQIRLGLFDEAETTVDRSPAPDADERARAFFRVASARAQGVRRLLLDGRLDEVEPALEAIQRLASRCADPGAVGRLVAELRASHRTETLAVRLRAAERSLADGEPAAARVLAAGVVVEAAEGSPLASAAQALVDRIDGVPPPQVNPTFVRPVVSEAELARLNGLLAVGRFDDAEVLLEDLEGRVGGVEGWWIAPKLKEVRRVIRHNRFVDAYNGAIDLADEGWTEQAIDALEALLASDPDNPEAPDARVLLAKLRGHAP